MIDNVIKIAKPVEVPLAERMGWHAVRQQGAFVVMRKEEEACKHSSGNTVRGNGLAGALDEPDRATELLKTAVIASIMGYNV